MLVERELGSFPFKTVCYAEVQEAGQFDFNMDLEITIIVTVCKQQLFRRELCFHVKWKVGVLAFRETNLE